MSNKLRADITGLRAIAVLAVTLFHISYVLKPDDVFFSGGFLGVDIFFVISGFLMTQIIMNGLSNNSFNLLEFYQKRAKRICPALLVVVVITLLSSLVLFRSDFVYIGIKESLAALGFISNFRFAKSVDYFDGGDFSHLFLHTWSLSVEWQFYIFYPVLLMLLVKTIGLKHIGKVLLLLTLVGFITAIVWTDVNPRQSYYLLPSRACELLVGSLAFYYPLDKISKINNRLGGGQLNKIFEILGILFIIASIFIIDNTDGWPTAWMLLPLTGSWLCIAANNKQSVLSNIVFQKIGLWSYAIYLVHWPIIVYVNALGWAKYSFLWLLPIIALGILLHIFVEKKRNYGYKFLVVYLCVVGVVFLTKTFELHNMVRSNTNESLELYGGEFIPEDTALMVGNGSPSFILHGDSYSRELVAALFSKKISLISNNQNGCYSLGTHVKDDRLDVDVKTEQKCNDIYAKTKAIARNYQSIPLVIIQNWSFYGFSNPKEYGQTTKPFHMMDNFKSTIPPSEFEKFVFDDILKVAQDFHDRTVYIVGKKQENSYYGTNSSAYHMLSVWAKHNLSNVKPEFLKAKEHIFSINQFLKDAVIQINNIRDSGAKLADLVYVEPNVYCSNGVCELFTKNLLQIYSDTGHYSHAGAEKAATNLLSIMKIDTGADTNEAPFQKTEKVGQVTYSELKFKVDDSQTGNKYILIQ